MSSADVRERDLPAYEALRPNEMRVIAYGEMDDYGKVRFSAYWRATDHLRQGKVRGQVFHTNLAVWVRRLRADGWEVTATDPYTKDLLVRVQ